MEPVKRKRGEPIGYQNAVKHGFYSRERRVSREQGKDRMGSSYNREHTPFVNRLLPRF